MDNSIIAVITLLVPIVQAIGTFWVVKIQNNQIDGLRTSINDQKSAIEALKTQAEGQASLTEQQKALTTQMSQLMTGVLADAEKRLTIVKETAALETSTIQQKLEKAQAEIEEQKREQIQAVDAINNQNPLADMVVTLIKESSSTKDDVAIITAQLTGFISSTQNMLNDIRPILASTQALLSQKPSNVLNNSKIISELNEVSLTTTSIDNYLTQSTSSGSILYKLIGKIGGATGTAMITAPMHPSPSVLMLRELGIGTISGLDNALKENQKQIILFASHWVDRLEKEKQNTSVHHLDFPLFVLIYWLLSNKSKDYIKTFFEELGIFGFPGPYSAVWRLPKDVEQLSNRIIHLGELTKSDLALSVDPT